MKGELELKHIYVVLPALVLLIVLNGCSSPKLSNNAGKDTNKTIINSDKKENISSTNENSKITTNEKEVDQTPRPFYGEWEVKKIIGYSKVFAESVGNIPIGTKVIYSAEWMKYGENYCKKPEYNMTTFKKDDFESGERIDFKDLGINADSIVQVDVKNCEYSGGYFYIKDNNTLIYVAAGKFFEVVRTVPTEKKP